MTREYKTANSGCWWICLHPSSSIGSPSTPIFVATTSRRRKPSSSYGDLGGCSKVDLSHTLGSCRYLIFPGLSWCRLCLMWSICVSLVSWFLPNDGVVCGLMYVALLRALQNSHVIKSRRNVTSTFISEVEMQQYLIRGTWNHMFVPRSSRPSRSWIWKKI